MAFTLWSTALSINNVDIETTNDFNDTRFYEDENIEDYEDTQVNEEYDYLFTNTGVDNKTIIQLSPKVEKYVTKVNRSMWKMQQGDLMEDYNGAKLTLIFGNQGVANKLVFNALSGHIQTQREPWRPWHGHVQSKFDRKTMSQNLIVAPPKIQIKRNQSWEISFAYWVRKAAQVSDSVKTVLVITWDLVIDVNTLLFHDLLYSFVQFFFPNKYKRSNMLVIVADDLKTCKSASVDLKRYLKNHLFAIQERANARGMTLEQIDSWRRCADLFTNWINVDYVGNEENVKLTDKVIVVYKKSGIKEHLTTLGKKKKLKRDRTSVYDELASIAEAVNRVPHIPLDPSDFVLKLKHDVSRTLAVITKRNLELFSTQIRVLCKEISKHVESHCDYIENNYGSEAPNVLKKTFYKLIQLIVSMEETQNPSDFLEGFKKMVKIIGISSVVKVKSFQEVLEISRVLYISFTIKPRNIQAALMVEWRGHFYKTAIIVKKHALWNLLLRNVFEFLSGYKVQAHRERYGDRNIKDWGKFKTDHGSQESFTLIEKNFEEVVTTLAKVTQTYGVNTIKYNPKRLEQLQKVLTQTLRAQVKYDCSNKDHIIIEGDYLVFSKINWTYCPNIHRQLGNPSTYPPVSILLFAYVRLFIDVDLEMTGSRIMLFVIAPKWYIHGKVRHLKLDGRDADSKPQAAKGKPGERGFPGGTAGCFVGLAEEIEDQVLLKITTNGGRGGNGQIGGVGKPGKNASTVSLPNGNVSEQTVINELDGVNSLKNKRIYIRYREGKDRYEKQKEHRRWGKSEQWIFAVKGADAENGHPGREGGKGGFGGKLGYINITCAVKCDDVQKYAKDGLDGKSSEGGLGGLGGWHEPDFRLRLLKNTTFLHTSNKPAKINVHWSAPMYKKSRGRAEPGPQGEKGKSEINTMFPSEPVCFQNQLEHLKVRTIVNNYVGLLSKQVFGNSYRNATSYTFIEWISEYYLQEDMMQTAKFDDINLNFDYNNFRKYNKNRRNLYAQGDNLRVIAKKFFNLEKMYIKAFPNISIEEMKTALRNLIIDDRLFPKITWLRFAMISKICALNQLSNIVLDPNILGNVAKWTQEAFRLRSNQFLLYIENQTTIFLDNTKNGLNVQEDYDTYRTEITEAIAGLFYLPYYPNAYILVADRLTQWAITTSLKNAQGYLHFLLKTCEFLYAYIKGGDSSQLRTDVVTSGSNLLTNINAVRKDQMQNIKLVLEFSNINITENVKALIMNQEKLLLTSMKDGSTWNRNREAIIKNLLDYKNKNRIVDSSGDYKAILKIARCTYIITISTEVYNRVKKMADKIELDPVRMYNSRFVLEQFDKLIENTVECILASPEFAITSSHSDEVTLRKLLSIRRWKLGEALNQLKHLIQNAGEYGSKTMKMDDVGRITFSSQLLMTADRLLHLFSNLEGYIWQKLLNKLNPKMKLKKIMDRYLVNIVKNNMLLSIYFRIHKNVQLMEFPFANKPQPLKKILRDSDQHAWKTKIMIKKAIDELRVPYASRIKYVKKNHRRDVFKFYDKYSLSIENLVMGKPVYLRPEIWNSEHAKKGHAHKYNLTSVRFVFDVEEPLDDPEEKKETQEKLREWINGAIVDVTHMGDSIYRCGTRFFQVNIPQISFSYIYDYDKFNNRTEQIKEEIENSKPRPPGSDADDKKSDDKKYIEIYKKMEEFNERIEHCKQYIVKWKKDIEDLRVKMQTSGFHHNRLIHYALESAEESEDVPLPDGVDSLGSVDHNIYTTYDNRRMEITGETYPGYVEYADEITMTMTTAASEREPSLESSISYSGYYDNEYYSEETTSPTSITTTTATTTTITIPTPSSKESLMIQIENIQQQINGFVDEIKLCKEELDKLKTQVNEPKAKDDGNIKEVDVKPIEDDEVDGFGSKWISKYGAFGTWRVQISKSYPGSEETVQLFAYPLSVSLRGHFAYLPEEDYDHCSLAAHSYQPFDPPEI